jgi:hypothetical protein
LAHTHPAFRITRQESRQPSASFTGGLLTNVWRRDAALPIDKGLYAIVAATPQALFLQTKQSVRKMTEA